MLRRVMDTSTNERAARRKLAKDVLGSDRQMRRGHERERQCRGFPGLVDGTRMRNNKRTN